MSVRINLEIGHEASVRAKSTLEGFTHDWEVFVRGSDNASIYHYVEKVVFYLHDTFKNPKRVIKEPPYTVKESGYAGFILLIEVYFRTKEDPKKLKFSYDITLQKTGPALFKLQKEKYVFNAPNEEFKQKLLKGGGVVVKNSQENARENRTPSEEKSQLISKPRLGGSDYVKKHKPKIESNNFQELFGTPITKASKVVEIKPASKEKNSTNSSSTKSGSSEKDKSKYSPYKEKEKDREKYKDKSDFNRKDKDEKRKDDRKDRSKDREKKERREKSPRSPTPSKRLSSPKRPPSPLPKYKDKDEKKVEVQKKSSDDSKEKNEKKIKKDKRDKDKERHENKRKDNQKVSDQKDRNVATKEKEKINETSPLVPPKSDKKERINLKDFIKETENGKIKSDRVEEKPKHKHKKKDKERDKIIEKEKSYKTDIKKNDKEITKDLPKQSEKQPSLFDSPKDSRKSEKNMHLVLPESIIDSDASNSSISSPEISFNEPLVKRESKTFDPQPPPPPISPIHQPSPPPSEPQKIEKVKKDKTKKNKDKKTEKDTERKKKRKSEQKQVDEPLQKVLKDESLNLNSTNKESDSEGQLESEVRRTVTDRRMVPEPIEENCEDYMNILRDLQQKILTLQDNSELQKVVELIAETGRYEVSAQTFDFDLCLLERSTILQLQNFFESTS